MDRIDGHVVMGQEGSAKAVASCASCGVEVASADAYLSGLGTVCGACHKEEAAADRDRSTSRETDVGTLLAGVISSICGAGLMGTALFSPAVPIKLTLGCVFVSGIAVVRALTAPGRSAHAKLGRVLVLVGAGLAALALVLLFVRFSDGFVVEDP
jgi:hypothetical protein